MKNKVSQRKNVNKQKVQKNPRTVMNAVPKNQDKPNFTIFRSCFIFFSLVCIAICFASLSGVFNITNIYVEGNSKISEEQVVSFSKIQRGKNIFSLSISDVINNLKKNSYIENCEIKRIWPNQIKIIVEERSVDYILQLSNSYVYVDKNGNVLEISSEKLEKIVLLGFSTDLSNIKSNDSLNDSDLKKLKIVEKIVDTAEEYIGANLIKRMDISDPENYTIYLDTEGKVAYLGNESNLNLKFVYIKAILKEQAGKTGEIFVNIDFNNEEDVYFAEI